MWIVRLALRRPYTFVVLSLLLFFLGPVVIERTPVDIFPNIDIPVVSVIWSYAGLSPQQLSDRITVQYERSLTTTVNDIEHTESQTLNGISVIKVYFRPTVNISQAVAQVTAISQTALRSVSPRHDASAHHSVQCIQRAGAATWALRQRLDRAAVERLWVELHSHPAGHRAGRLDPEPLRRQAAAGAGGYRHPEAPGLRPLRRRRGERHGHAEYHPARRRREDGPCRLSGGNQQRSGYDCGAERSADQDLQRHHHLRSRRGQCARRLPSADQHRAGRRTAGIAAYHPEDRKRIDAGYYLECTSATAADCGAASARRYRSGQSPINRSL